jgi:hypothetical protein
VLTKVCVLLTAYTLHLFYPSDILWPLGRADSNCPTSVLEFRKSGRRATFVTISQMSKRGPTDIWPFLCSIDPPSGHDQISGYCPTAARHIHHKLIHAVACDTLLDCEYPPISGQTIEPILLEPCFLSYCCKALPSPAMGLTDQEIDTLIIIERTTASISVTGTLILFATFILIKDFRTLSNTLIFYASFANLFANVAALIGGSALSHVNGALCQFQGFLLDM